MDKKQQRLTLLATEALQQSDVLSFITKRLKPCLITTPSTTDPCADRILTHAKRYIKYMLPFQSYGDLCVAMMMPREVEDMTDAWREQWNAVFNCVRLYTSVDRRRHTMLLLSEEIPPPQWDLEPDVTTIALTSEMEEYMQAHVEHKERHEEDYIRWICTKGVSYLLQLAIEQHHG